MSRTKGKAPALPPLHVRAQPGLSDTLTGPRDPRHCQSCSRPHTKERPIARWLEHDAWDKVPARGARVVVLCAVCSLELIEAHPRLYKQLGANEPFPGCMSICLTCPHRDGVACTSPLAKMNGGTGLAFDGGPHRPDWMHLNFGGGRGRTVLTYHMPMQDCSGRPMVPA